MKILVLGRNGMLGNVVYDFFSEKGYDVIGTDIKGDGIYYDAFSNINSLEDIIKENCPNVIINCIGILNKVAEDNKLLAVRLNSELPHYIDYLSNQYNFKFIHVSTDCVFSGNKGNYDELSLPDAESFYGRSKALGEITTGNNITLRTSIIGPDNNPNGIGLFQWFMNQKNEVYGYKDVIWTGVTTLELAKQMEVAIKKDIKGLNHVVNNEMISKYDLLNLFKEVFNKDINILENNEVKSYKTLIRTDNSYNFSIPSYNAMIIEMKNWILEHKEKYKNIIENSGLEFDYNESNDNSRN